MFIIFSKYEYSFYTENSIVFIQWNNKNQTHNEKTPIILINSTTSNLLKFVTFLNDRKQYAESFYILQNQQIPLKQTNQIAYIEPNNNTKIIPGYFYITKLYQAIFILQNYTRLFSYYKIIPGYFRIAKLYQAVFVLQNYTRLFSYCKIIPGYFHITTL